MTVLEALNKAVGIAGGQATLARAIGVKPPAITQWINGTRPIPPVRASQIEKITNVSRKHLCPDFPWEPNGKDAA